jgi:uncharacterized protein
MNPSGHLTRGSENCALVSRRNVLAGGTALVAALVAAPVSSIGSATPRCDERFPSCPVLPGAGPFKVGPVNSTYIVMPDGTKIAVDVVLPLGLTPGTRIPTVLTMTRYWRARLGDSVNATGTLYASHGYAVVDGDVRGTGASFGIWTHQRSRGETRDFGDIIDWIVRQPWSDGQVIGTGNSYAGNTADWMVPAHRKALKAVVPRFPDYDPYSDLYFPGGVPNAFMGRVWGMRVKDLDLNIKDGDPTSRGVRPVESDTHGAELASAIAERKLVPSVWTGLQQVVFRDDRPASWQGESMVDWAISTHFRSVEAAGTPIQTWAGWMDAGTAHGALKRFVMLSNAQRAFIGAWSHGGLHDASPYKDKNAIADPPYPLQLAEDVCFMRESFSGAAASRHDKVLHYYTMGEEKWKSTRVWPLASTRRQIRFLGDKNTLSLLPSKADAADTYKVDFSATTGKSTRWSTNNDGSAVDYGNRAPADEKMLCYTSEALAADIEVTGHPVVHLRVDSTHADCAFFVYLEDVAPDGYVRYLTEGQLRAIHRRVVDPFPYKAIGPYHSFLRKDAEPLIPGEIAEIAFALMPISVVLRAGHRIRMSIAGADADTFTRIPADAVPIWRIHRGPGNSSKLILPVIPRGH